MLHEPLAPVILFGWAPVRCSPGRWRNKWRCQPWSCRRGFSEIPLQDAWGFAPSPLLHIRGGLSALKGVRLGQVS